MRIDEKNMYQPLVTIVIPAYNASNYLAEAIDSALTQTYKNIEIIVVNDGSKDDGATAAVAAKYGDKIRYFSKENGGSSSALNCGIRNMTGEWFSWLSHDDLYYPQKIQTQIEYLQNLDLSDSELSECVLFAGSELIDENGSTIRKPSAKNINAVRTSLDNLQGNEYLIAEPTNNMFHGCSCLVHRSVFEKVGIFDESLRLLNDVDMWFRIYAGNFSVHYVPNVLVKGRVHAKQVSRSIGFSYHNSEQDMFWNRSLEWLKQNHPSNYHLFLLFGRNAYLKTRFKDGDNAFAVAASLKPENRFILKIRKFVYILRANIRTIGKKLYLKIKM